MSGDRETFIFLCDFFEFYEGVQRHLYTYHGLLVFRYHKWLRNIPEIQMLNELNKVFKDNPIFISFLFYFTLPPLL